MESRKVTDTQLKKINDQQSSLNNLLNNIGILEVQKQKLTSDVKKLGEQIEETKKELEEEYGNVNIDLKDGSISDIKGKDE
jgi:predicted  nucleic acid-binding Zn-ribbon protein